MATVIRDAIWGDIELGSRELALIDTPAFQRLRRVRQLGLTDLVFPGATHTRFEHSIGVYHLAGRVAERLGLGDASVLRAAALLHDVGHYPFSHAIEELENDVIRRHEDIARDIVRSGEVADVLTGEWGIDPEHVAEVIAGAGGVPGAVLDGSVDVDKLDYLVRDARAANVPYGVVDVQRVIGSLAVSGDSLAIDAKGITALQSLVFAKHLMFATVYWHHACRSAVAMLLRAVQEGLGAGVLTAAELERADDASLLARLESPLAARLRVRSLYKRAAEVRLGDEPFAALEPLWFDPSRRARVEDSWAAALGAPPASILLDIPEPRPIVVDIPVIEDGRPRRWEEASELVSSDLERFQRVVRKIRVFAADEPLAASFRPELLATTEA